MERLPSKQRVGGSDLVGGCSPCWYDWEKCVKECTGYIGNNFGRNGLSRVSSTRVRLNSLIESYRRIGAGLRCRDFYKPRQVGHQRRYFEGHFIASRQERHRFGLHQRNACTPRIDLQSRPQRQRRDLALVSLLQGRCGLQQLRCEEHFISKLSAAQLFQFL